MRTRLRILETTLIVYLCAESAQAQSKQEPPVASWRCSLPGFSESISFIYDIANNEGLIVGNIGTSKADVKLGNEAVSFIETVSTGAVQTITIKLSDGASVYSRHSIMGDKFSPSQVEGNCIRTD